MSKAKATKNLAAIILGSALVVTFAFAFATPASAASISGVGTAIFSGQTNLYGNAGQNVNVNTNFDVPVGEVLHAVQTDFIGDNVPPVCHVVGVVEGAQNNVSVSFSELLSPNAGNYGFTMNAFTAATVPQANALNQNQGTACTGTNTTVYNQGNVVHVLPGGSVGTNTGGASAPSFQDLLNMIADLNKQISCMVTGGSYSGGTCTPKPAPTDNGVCAKLESYDFSKGDQGKAVKNAQKYIIAHDGDIAAGATGYWGTQSENALSEALDANNCQ